MKTLFLLFLLGAGSLPAAQATNYYVAATGGSNSTATGAGRSIARPFATMQYAANLTLPGDTVFVRGGTYVGTSSDAVSITRSGSPTAWIVYRNYRDEQPLLQFNRWQGFNLHIGVAYIEINGFHIQGNNRNVVLADALNQPAGCAANGVGAADSQYNGNGISVDGRTDISQGRPHHLRFVHNTVFECGGAGISAIQADYVTIENNLVYNNAWYTIYGASGISLLSSWNYDTAPGYHLIIRNNRCFGNRLYVPWYNRGGAKCEGITDGNGIIIDSNRDQPYTGRTLVANNLVVNNGGSGIHSYSSDHVDVINNTAYHNSQSPETTGGEIFANHTDDALFENNILVADASNVLNTNSHNTNVGQTHNLFFGGTGNSGLGTSPVQADPQFVNATTDWATADFRLLPTSPAIDHGLNSNLTAVDLAGHPRLAGSNPDIGAYEFSAPLPVELTAFTAEARNGTASLAWTTASEKNNAGFVVEVSANGSEFRRLGWVAGHGSSSAAATYTFTDAALAGYPGPAVYYRLQQLDADGVATFSPVRVVAVGARITLTLVLWPNPAHRGITVAGGQAGQPVQVSDAAGRIRLTTVMPATGLLELTLPALVPGLYVVRSGQQSFRFAVE